MSSKDKYTPRRSLLYIPGANERALEKIPTLDADGFIVDLEDAVAPDQKEKAREKIEDILPSLSLNGRELIIRINGLKTQWSEDDLKIASQLNPNAILVPKVEKTQTIGHVNELMNDFGASKKTRIWAMIETPAGVLNVKKIARSHKRLKCLVMGTSDLTNDLKARHTPDRTPLVASLGLCILAARASKKDIIDGVHLDLNDEEGFYASCVQGRDFGFDGKSLIHPKQINVANQIFGPSDSDINHAHRVIDAYEEAIRKGSGVVLLDGKLIENLHVEHAKRTLHMAEIIAYR